MQRIICKSNFQNTHINHQLPLLQETLPYFLHLSHAMATGAKMVVEKLKSDPCKISWEVKLFDIVKMRGKVEVSWKYVNEGGGDMY